MLLFWKIGKVYFICQLDFVQDNNLEVKAPGVHVAYNVNYIGTFSVVDRGQILSAGDFYNACAIFLVKKKKDFGNPRIWLIDRIINLLISLVPFLPACGIP